MRTIVVASTNPVKARATRNGFTRMFPDEPFRVETVDVSSGVADQPRSGAETMQGALGRARAAARRLPDADFWVGLEGGVEERDGDMLALSWVAVLSADAVGKGRSGSFLLPEAVARRIRDGVELGTAMDDLLGESDTKRRGGAVGALTGGVIDRTRLYEEAVVLALVRFRNPALYARE